MMFVLPIRISYQDHYLYAQIREFKITIYLALEQGKTPNISHWFFALVCTWSLECFVLKHNYMRVYFEF